MLCTHTKLGGYMRSGLAKQLMLMTLFTGMAEDPSKHYREDDYVKREKKVIEKTCPVCGTMHQNENRFCDDDCRDISRKLKKERKNKRNNKKKKFKH